MKEVSPAQSISIQETPQQLRCFLNSRFGILQAMKLLSVIGEKDEAIDYVERPTVKVVIERNDEVLILNDGLLPGGGVDYSEANERAITRELLEELGATVSNIQEIGQVIQYRTFLGREYQVYGYAAQFKDFTSPATPQDAGEAAFVYKWMPRERAIQYITESIAILENTNSQITNDTTQGAIYNRMTSLALLKAIK
jgi:8-oxo-dGTP pyrophosphatase MutT (NUDIX family)